MIILVSFLSGIMASMGLGGGMVLVVYLTLFARKSQLLAQGVNLIFFIPIAVISLILHSKKGLVKWKFTLLPMIFGGVFVCIFSFLAQHIQGDFLSKIFSIFLISVGLLQIFKNPKK